MKITLAATKKTKPDFSALGFGRYFTDHMLVMDYRDGAWQEMKIVPFQNFEMSPATNVLHYAQGIFEGAKAYKNPETGAISVFRIKENLKRMNRSAARLSMPELDEKAVKKGLFELLRLERDWIPTSPGTSLYIRPTLIATEEVLGVHASKFYKFFIILSPVGAYYANGLAPTKIKVEEFYARSVMGGTGEAKCMANYSISLLAAEVAKKDGFDQVLWLDGAKKKFVEEVGAMNIFFVIDGVVVTPKLTGTFLPGITRRSCIEILKKLKAYPVKESKLTIEQIAKAHAEGRLTECFGTGTAAVVAPVGLIRYKGKDMTLNNGKIGEVTKYLYDTLTGIQYGKIKDPFNWVEQV